MTGLKRKPEGHKPPVTLRRETSRDTVSRRFIVDEAAREAVAERARLTDELEAEMAVTRICDSILGRLDEVTAQKGQTQPRRRQIN